MAHIAVVIPESLVVSWNEGGAVEPKSWGGMTVFYTSGEWCVDILLGGTRRWLRRIIEMNNPKNGYNDLK